VDLSTRDLDVLFEPRFLIRPDVEHLRGATTDVDVPARPVLFGSRQSPYLRVDPAYTDPLPDDVAAREAFNTLCRQLDAVTVDVALAPGDVLLVDNYRAVHGRRPFEARYDGNDRWLRKMTVVRDLRQSRHRRSEAHTRALSPG
jgi:L-asparagine oxygenase